MARDSIVSGKGQITLPKAVREALGVQPGDRIRFVINGAEVRMVKAANGAALAGGGGSDSPQG